MRCMYIPRPLGRGESSGDRIRACCARAWYALLARQDGPERGVAASTPQLASFARAATTSTLRFAADLVYRAASRGDQSRLPST